MGAAIIPFPARSHAPQQPPKKADLRTLYAELAEQKRELTRLCVNMAWAIQQVLDAAEDRQ